MKKRWLAGLTIGIIIIAGSCPGYLQYGSRHQLEIGKAMFSFSYLPEDKSRTYNIVHDPEKFMLEME